MVRIVMKTAHGPVEVKVGDESKWICQCGLTTNPPFCSGMHKKTLDEKEGKVYVYHPDGTRTELA